LKSLVVHGSGNQNPTEQKLKQDKHNEKRGIRQIVIEEKYLLGLKTKVIKRNESKRI
jgi:hypothetical protein